MIPTRLGLLKEGRYQAVYRSLENVREAFSSPYSIGRSEVILS